MEVSELADGLDEPVEGDEGMPSFFLRSCGDLMMLLRVVLVDGHEGLSPSGEALELRRKSLGRAIAACSLAWLLDDCLLSTRCAVLVPCCLLRSTRCLLLVADDIGWVASLVYETRGGMLIL
jgi:hypothetical protein